MPTFNFSPCYQEPLRNSFAEISSKPICTCKQEVIEKEDRDNNQTEVHENIDVNACKEVGQKQAKVCQDFFEFVFCVHFQTQIHQTV